MSATLGRDCSESGAVLHVAFELGWQEWGLAFSVGLGRKPRRVSIAARDVEDLAKQIERAKRRWRLPADAPVRSCYEAGRDGFWLHRFLTAQDIDNVVVDSSSIEVKRRARHAKSDKLDVEKLLQMLLRYHLGERSVWSVVRVPTPEQEDARQGQRELQDLKGQRTRHINKIKGLLAGQGLEASITPRFEQQVPELRCWDGSTLGLDLQARLLRECQRLRLVEEQIRQLQREQARRARESAAPAQEQVRTLLRLRGIGLVGASVLTQECFAWRRFANRRQLGSFAGLTPTPYQSGQSDREQGISRAGNRRLRAVLIELAWSWLRHQPESRLSCWYRERFGSGSRRLRKIGIVALARKLLIALWRYVTGGEVPEGAELVCWRGKLNHRAAIPVLA